MSDLIETGNVPTSHTDVLKKRVERLVAAIIAVRRAPRWRTRTLVDEAANIMSTIDERMRPYRELLVELHFNTGTRVETTKGWLGKIVDVWVAIRRDAYQALRSFGWRGAQNLRLVHSSDRVPVISSAREEVRVVNWQETNHDCSGTLTIVQTPASTSRA